jgi:hypothetical protein
MYLARTTLCARRAAIDEIFHEDAVFYDPKGGIFRGRDEINRIAGVIKAAHPDFKYQPLSPPEEVGNVGRVRWVSGAPGKPRRTREPILSSPEMAVSLRSISFSIVFRKQNVPPQSQSDFWMLTA